MSLAICPGSFDPITLGHLDIISRSAQIFDNVIVCIMFNSNKTKPMFTISERVEMVKKVVECFPNVRVDTSAGLLAEYAKQFDGAVIVKGLRAASDFEYEFQMNHINKKDKPRAGNYVSYGKRKIYFSELIRRTRGRVIRRRSYALCAARDSGRDRRKG